MKQIFFLMIFAFPIHSITAGESESWYKRAVKNAVVYVGAPIAIGATLCATWRYKVVKNANKDRLAEIKKIENDYRQSSREYQQLGQELKTQENLRLYKEKADSLVKLGNDNKQRIGTLRSELMPFVPYAIAKWFSWSTWFSTKK